MNCPRSSERSEECRTRHVLCASYGCHMRLPCRETIFSHISHDTEMGQGGYLSHRFTTRDSGEVSQDTNDFGPPLGGIPKVH